MVRIERLADPSDPRLSDFRNLRDVQLRTRLEPEQGLFMAEGDKTIRRALAAGYDLRAMLCTEKWLEPLTGALAGTDAQVFVVDEPSVRSVTGFHVHRGALASFARRPLPEPRALLTGASRVVVLEDLTDHTNVGAIFRSAAALGWEAVLLTPRCADPLYRRAVKTSMGAVFQVPWTRLPAPDPAAIRGAGLVLVALTPSPDALAIEDFEAPPRIALALGAEGPGLSRRWMDAAGAAVRITMRAGIDSLNVSAAAAIALHALGPR
jgi:tRNA G18 (ribose-2'-O)-methylase SpoU